MEKISPTQRLQIAMELVGVQTSAAKAASLDDTAVMTAVEVESQDPPALTFAGKKLLDKIRKSGFGLSSFNRDSLELMSRVPVEQTSLEARNFKSALNILLGKMIEQGLDKDLVYACAHVFFEVIDNRESHISEELEEFIYNNRASGLYEKAFLAMRSEIEGYAPESLEGFDVDIVGLNMNSYSSPEPGKPLGCFRSQEGNEVSSSEVMQEIVKTLSYYKKLIAVDAVW